MRSEFTTVDQTFQRDLQECRNIIGITESLQLNLLGYSLDSLYRYSLVGGVASLDTFTHSLVRTGILLQLQGIGPNLDLALPLSAHLYRRWFDNPSGTLREIEFKIREAHSRWTMQFAKDIAEAVRLVSDRPLWITAAHGDKNLAGQMKNALDVIVRRRNQIAHESDLDPSTGEKWPIDATLTLQALNVIETTASHILEHVAAEYPD